MSCPKLRLTIKEFKMATKHGGARPGAGRKLGKVSQAKRDLAEMAKDHAELALQTLVEVATASESDAARVSAANALLDRGYGRPAQSVAISNPDGTALAPSVIQIVPVQAKHDDGAASAT
jgi:hypothetical protein